MRRRLKDVTMDTNLSIDYTKVNINPKQLRTQLKAKKQSLNYLKNVNAPKIVNRLVIMARLGNCSIEDLISVKDERKEP